MADQAAELGINAVSVIRALRLMREARIKDRADQRTVIAVDGTGETPLEAFLDPIEMKNLGSIQEEARNRYHQSQRRDVLKGGKNVGVPRQVYKELLEDVIAGEHRRIEKERQHKLHLQQMEEQRVLEAKIALDMEAEKLKNEEQAISDARAEGKKSDGLDFDARDDDGVQGGGQVRRMTTQDIDNLSDAGDDVQLDDGEQDELDIMAGDEDGRALRRAFRMQSMTPGQALKVKAMARERGLKRREDQEGSSDSSEDEDEDDFPASDRKSLMRRSTAPGPLYEDEGGDGSRVQGGPPPLGYVSEKDLLIRQKQRRRTTIIQAKEAKTLQLIREKEERIKRRAIMAQREHLIVSWLYIVSLTSRIQRMASDVINAREERKRWKNASVEKKAVRTIEMWWPEAFLALTMRRLPREVALVRVGVRRLWRSVQIKKRYASQALIIQFIKDTTGMGETVKKIYAFRAKILMVQAWVRSWFQIKQSRLRNLILYMERVEAQEREKMARAEEVMKMKSREAAEGIKGFGETLRKIDTVAAGVEELHAREAERTKWRAAQERTGKGAGAGNVLLQQGMSLMKWCRMVEDHHPNGMEKMQYAKSLLVESRRRFIITQDASLMPTEDRKPVLLTVNDASSFLKGALGDGTNADQTSTMVEEQRIRRRAPFYMHTSDKRAVLEDIEHVVHKKMVKEFRVMKEERQKQLEKLGEVLGQQAKEAKTKKKNNR